MININDILVNFNPISLNEMENVALMERIDKKFILKKSQLIDILEILNQNYSCLTIENEKIFKYCTEYLDDEKFLLFNNHHNGKLNRYKIRFRDYVQSKITFFEIKFKSNKGITKKTRIKIPFQYRLNAEECKEFIQKQTPYNISNFSTSLTNNFDRITLVSLSSKERVTIDFNLKFYLNEKIKSLKEICIIEVKKEKGDQASEVLSLLKKRNIRPVRISKYTIGSVLLNPMLKHNNFKKKLLLINNLSENGNVWNSTF